MLAIAGTYWKTLATRPCDCTVLTATEDGCKTGTATAPYGVNDVSTISDYGFVVIFLLVHLLPTMVI